MWSAAQPTLLAQIALALMEFREVGKVRKKSRERAGSEEGGRELGSSCFFYYPFSRVAERVCQPVLLMNRFLFLGHYLGISSDASNDISAWSFISGGIDDSVRYASRSRLRGSRQCEDFLRQVNSIRHGTWPVLARTQIVPCPDGTHYLAWRKHRVLQGKFRD